MSSIFREFFSEKINKFHGFQREIPFPFAIARKAAKKRLQFFYASGILFTESSHKK